jgi:hypothetical protein
MKTIVLNREFLEVDSRPGPELETYRRLLAQQVEPYLVRPGGLRACACPGCGAGSGAPAFSVFSLQYVECDQCGTLYVTPRPDDAAVAGFFRTSGAAAYWRDHVRAGTREIRREKVFRPRARWVLDVLDQYCPAASSVVLAGYHGDLLVEELRRLDPAHVPLRVTNPLADLECAQVAGPRVVVEAVPLEALRDGPPADVFLVFDLLDRCADVNLLFMAMRERLRSGGLVLATATLASGFDVQALWDRAPVLLPPERLNLFSTAGLTRLIERHGFEIVEFSTPGVLDAEIVQRAMRTAPEAGWPRPLRQLIAGADAEALTAFQEHLQRFRLSSFGRVVLRVPGMDGR